MEIGRIQTHVFFRLADDLCVEQRERHTYHARFGIDVEHRDLVDSTCLELPEMQPQVVGTE